jgi:hypothetical protein
MCPERAALARKELDYWLAEAEESRRLKESPELPIERIPVQLDWCAESNFAELLCFDERKRRAKVE